MVRCVCKVHIMLSMVLISALPLVSDSLSSSVLAVMISGVGADGLLTGEDFPDDDLGAIDSFELVSLAFSSDDLGYVSTEKTVNLSLSFSASFFFSSSRSCLIFLRSSTGVSMGFLLEASTQTAGSATDDHVSEVMSV